MKYLAVVLTVFLTLFISKNVFSETLTLQQALDEAYGGSLQLQSAKSAKSEASWKKVQSYVGFLPTINVGASYIMSQRFVVFNVSPFPDPIPEVAPSSAVVVTAELPLFDGFASTNRYLSGKRFEEAADKNYDWTKFSLERKVVLQYYKSLASQILNEVAEQNYKTLQDHKNDVDLSRKAGISTKYDVLRVEVQVSESQSEILNSADNIEINKNKLAELLGKDSEPRDLKGDLPVLDAKLADKVTLDDVAHRGDLQALASRTEAMRYKDKADSRFWLPKISLYSQYQYYNNLVKGFGNETDYRDAYQLGFNLTWNIFDGMYSIGKSGESGEQYFQAQKGLEMQKIKAKQEFDFWKRKFKYYSVVYQARSSDVEKSTESVRLAREGRKAGVRTNTDMLDAEYDLFRARAALVNAQAGAIESLINLELATGQKLYNF